MYCTWCMWKTTLKRSVHRRYEIINIPRDFFAYQCVSTRVIKVMTPYSCCFEAYKLRDPQRFTSLSSSVLIANHNHTGFIWGSTGFTLENHCQSLLCKVYGNKVMTQQFCPCTRCLMPRPHFQGGKGSGELGQNPWACTEEFPRANQIAALALSYD